MSQTAPIDAPTPTPPAMPHPVGLLARLKLTEPVRLYMYAVLLVLTAGLQTAGVLTGDWPAFASANGAVLLGVGTAAEAVRASVYSPASAVRAAVRAARR